MVEIEQWNWALTVGLSHPRAIASQRGKQLFDRTDLDRCREFQRVLKQRFAKELRTLDPEHSYVPTLSL